MRWAVLLLLSVTVAACASETSEPIASPSSSEPNVTAATATAAESTGPGTSNDDSLEFPDVVAAVATREDAGTWRFDVTLSSPYDSPQRYADAWRVLGPDGTEFGIRVLTHDHASEQPFTRSQTGIQIPDGVELVTVQGRDLINGWGGEILQLTLTAA